MSPSRGRHAVARSHEVARSLARRGFTLVELIVVLVVIAIAGFVAVPELIRAMEVGADDGEVAPFTSLLRYARQRSIENAVIVRLIVDPEGLRYRADSAGVWGAGLLEEGIIELDPGVRMESDSTRLNYTFRPNGSAFGDTVVVSGRWGSSHISLDRWTGAINVYPY